MGRRLRLTAVALVLTLTPLGTAQAEVFSACWTSTKFDTFWGIDKQITRCRVSGGSVVDYASDSAVPSVLSPQTGTDATGQCWYYTSASTSYVVITQYANGDADIGFDTDPGVPGGIIAIGPTLPRCTSEPSVAPDPSSIAWRYVSDYIHDPPAPSLNPRPGDGITGLATYVQLPIPPEHTNRLSGGGTTLDVFIEVSTVIVAWGDGETDIYPATSTAMAGYPDGWASHIYETKGDERSITVSYDWTARWRRAGGAWRALAVPNTSTSVSYPVSEIVSDLTG